MAERSLSPLIAAGDAIERLPERPARAAVVVTAQSDTATLGRFADGRIGEIFLNDQKSNSTADANARDAAIVFSIAVQHGADVETIRRAETSVRKPLAA